DDLAAAGRRLLVLARCETYLGRCIKEEEKALAGLRSIAQTAQAIRRAEVKVRLLDTEVAHRQSIGDPMSPAEYRARADACWEGPSRESRNLALLDHWVELAYTADWSRRVAKNEGNWSRAFAQGGYNRAQFFHVDVPFWGDRGQLLLRSDAGPPEELRPRVTLRRRALSVPSDEGGEEADPADDREDGESDSGDGTDADEATSADDSVEAEDEGEEESEGEEGSEDSSSDTSSQGSSSAGDRGGSEEASSAEESGGESASEAEDEEMVDVDDEGESSGEEEEEEDEEESSSEEEDDEESEWHGFDDDDFVLSQPTE
ncbi:hypothetical protein F4861DRAFT_544644, partial [Xylaria intraflava]